MKERELYYIRPTGNPEFNYYFDKITSLFVKHQKGPIKNPKKILFIRNDHIGDMVYSTQVFREVKKLYPHVELHVLASPSNKELIEKDKNVDKIIESHRFWHKGFKGFINYFKIISKIKKENYDVGIDLRRSKLNMFFYLFIPGIKKRAGYYNVNGGKAFLTHPFACEEKTVNVFDISTMAGKFFGINLKNSLPEIHNDEEDEKDYQEIIKKNKIKKYIVFGPGATEDSKRWPEKKFNELIEKFHKKYPNHKIILSGATSDKQLINRLSKGRDYCIPLINFNLRKMALVYKNSDAVVANDGCGSDISWVAGGKLVTLVGPVDIELQNPPKNTIVIHHELPCYPCNYNKPCKKPFGKWCMDLISVDEVFEAVEKQMKS